jgi:hypothetical protein
MAGGYRSEGCSKASGEVFEGVLPVGDSMTREVEHVGAA